MIICKFSKFFILCVLVAELSHLFEGSAVAHTLGEIGSFVIVCPMIIPLVNLLKFIYIAQFKPHEKLKPLFKTMMVVVLFEIISAFLAYTLIGFLDNFLRAYTSIEMTERSLFYFLIISFWILSTYPNTDLLEGEFQTLKEAFSASQNVSYLTISAPKKAVYAAILASITPIIQLLLVIKYDIW